MTQRRFAPIPSTVFHLALLSVLLFTGPLAAQEEFLATTVEIVAMKGDRAAITEDLAEWVDANGGYYTYRSETEIHLRVPSDRIAGVRTRLERHNTEIIRYDPATDDYRQALSNAQAAITARTDALERVLRYIETASVTGTLAFELELRALNEDIETYTGQIRRIRNDIRFARVYVRLSSHDHTLPVDGWSSWSSFQWINELGIYKFLDRHRMNRGYRR